MVFGSMVIPKYSDPKIIYTPKDIQFDMLSEHGVNLTYMQAWRAKEKALQFLRRHPADSYSKLPSYLYIPEKTYLGSVVKLKKTDDDCFLPVVVVDETFLKSAYMEIMLTASTMDAAGTILPLAYVVVGSENDASWKWSLGNSSSRMFKKGHLKLSELYFATAWSYTLDAFNERMSKIEEINPRVKTYLYDIGYHRWSRVHATVNRTWTMTSNIAESLNAVTKYARELLIVELLEYMRTLHERWTKEKLLKAKGTFTYLAYKFNKELDDNRTLSHKLRVRSDYLLKQIHKQHNVDFL
ncbi:uncharacterized protein LOC142162132 [Nicotiana tabacum]|uniref:Uncharacterized protein LOC142162132 n=1 Tax=Nicotiana tabacum TaxID=4097 RepID=A0AC58RP95_TOBAC